VSLLKRIQSWNSGDVNGYRSTPRKRWMGVSERLGLVAVLPVSESLGHHRLAEWLEDCLSHFLLQTKPAGAGLLQRMGSIASLSSSSCILDRVGFNSVPKVNVLPV